MLHSKHTFLGAAARNLCRSAVLQERVSEFQIKEDLLGRMPHIRPRRSIGFVAQAEPLLLTMLLRPRRSYLSTPTCRLCVASQPSRSARLQTLLFPCF